MIIGASTACLFPSKTEVAFTELARLGFDCIEIFFNALNELHGEVFDKIKEAQECYGIKVPSLHPFTSFAESFLFFSPYRRRLYDGLEFYKHYFDAANRLGADILVIHGCKEEYKIDEDDYIERFGELVSLGESFGVRVAQENVVKYMSQDKNLLLKMQKDLGDKFHMVFDIKQAIRSGYDPFEIVDCLGKSFVHIHLNDNNTANNLDCMLPGQGRFDFEQLFKKLNALNYNGNAVIELYRANFNAPKDLKQGKMFLENI